MGTSVIKSPMYPPYLGDFTISKTGLNSIIFSRNCSNANAYIFVGKEALIIFGLNSRKMNEFQYAVVCVNVCVSVCYCWMQKIVYNTSFCRVIWRIICRWLQFQALRDSATAQNKNIYSGKYFILKLSTTNKWVDIIFFIGGKAGDLILYPLLLYGRAGMMNRPKD